MILLGCLPIQEEKQSYVSGFPERKWFDIRRRDLGHERDDIV